MAWSKVGESTFLVATGSGTESVSLPGSPATGDVVLVILAADQGLAGDGTTGGGGITSSDSYTPIATGNLLPSYQVAYKVMGGTPDSTVGIDRSADVSRPIAGIIQIWRGADTTTTIDATPSINSGTGLPNPPSHTTVTNGALRVIVGLLDDDTALTTAAPSGYTNFLSATTTGATGNFGATVMVASKEEATAGADDPGAFTGGAGSDDWVGLHFALRPAAGGGGATESGDGSASVSTSATAGGAAIVSGAGSGSISLAASSSGAGIGSGAGSSSVSASAAGIGASTYAGAGSSSGVVAASGVGSATKSAAGAAAVAAGASGGGGSTATAAGSASVTVTALGSSGSSSVAAGDGAATVTSSASAGGAAFASGSGAASTSVGTSGAASAISAGAGAAGIAVVAAGLVSVTATGVGAATIIVSGAGVSIEISDAEPSASRTLRIPAERRMAYVTAENRNIAIPAQIRSLRA